MNKNGLMTVSSFYLTLLTIIFTTESKADEVPTSGICNDAGTCLWSLSSNGTMTISAAINPETGKAYENVNMKDYNCNDQTTVGNRPWEQSIKKIKNLVVGDNITNIGSDAFQYAINLETVTGMKDVKTIRQDGFVNAVKLRIIETPSVEVISPWSLASTSLPSIDLPNIKAIYSNAIGSYVSLKYVGLPEGQNVIMGENALFSSLAGCSSTNRAACGSCGNDYIKGGLGCVADCGAGYLGKDGRCIDAKLGCGENYRQIENFCNKIQYTPAEAAKVLNDNNNSVTITFKK